VKSERAVLDVSDLPSVVFGHRGLLWWGTLGYVLAEGVTLALSAAAYFYLRRNFVVWPPHGTPKPDLLLPTIALGIGLVSTVPAYFTDHFAKKLERRGALISLGVLTVFSIVLLVLWGYQFGALNTRWDSNAYGSVTWTILGLHATLLIIEVGELLGMTGIFVFGPLWAKHYSDAEDVAMYWYFIIGIWVPLYVILFLVPYWW
jgi:heme/copper-type cytochrome/quinol oxidase subunit 3